MPNMIGSETFIIVAFRCSENSTPCAFASSICASTKRDSACALITAASITSPALHLDAGLEHVAAAVVADELDRRRVPACAISADCSLP